LVKLFHLGWQRKGWCPYRFSWSYDSVCKKCIDVIPAIQKINKQEQQAKKADQDIKFYLIMHAYTCAGMSACFICLYSMDHKWNPNTLAANISAHSIYIILYVYIVWVLSIYDNLASINWDCLKVYLDTQWSMKCPLCKHFLIDLHFYYLIDRRTKSWTTFYFIIHRSKSNHCLQNLIVITFIYKVWIAWFKISKSVLVLAGF